MGDIDLVGNRLLIVFPHPCSLAEDSPTTQVSARFPVDLCGFYNKLAPEWRDRALPENARIPLVSCFQYYGSHAMSG